MPGHETTAQRSLRAARRTEQGVYGEPMTVRRGETVVLARKVLELARFTAVFFQAQGKAQGNGQIHGVDLELFIRDESAGRADDGGELEDGTVRFGTEPGVVAISEGTYEARVVATVNHGVHQVSVLTLNDVDTYSLALDSAITADLARDATAADIQAAVDDAAGPDQFVVTRDETTVTLTATDFLSHSNSINAQNRLVEGSSDADFSGGVAALREGPEELEISAALLFFSL